MFFSELAANLGGQRNPLYLLYDRLKSEGAEIVDLVRGNVNESGIVYPVDVLRPILGRAADRARIYRPDSFGQPVARAAIAAYYGGLNISPNHVLVTPGTSFSYWYCFKLLAEVGDEILCPHPSYPLFDYIARLSGVQLRYYRLLEARDWAIDLDYLEDHITTRTRAIVVISPHNPTGMVASEQQLRDLAAIAVRHELPIISDEVFSEFVFEMESVPRAASTMAPLVFTLNGFSKMFALPGMKVGWMAVSGEKPLIEKAMSALEMMSDTFLPVNEIVQFAVPDIFREGQDFLRHYITWVAECRTQALHGLGNARFVRPAGGFYLSLPTARSEDGTAATLLEQEKLLVHPGYFYDIPGDHLVMTFVGTPPEVWPRIARAAESI